MTSVPSELKLTEEGDLHIVWSDGEVRAYTRQELRDGCPCATCREKRSAPPPDPLALTVLSPEEAQPIAIAGMRPIGSYAYGIAFSDGHDTGIFTLSYLKELGKPIG